MTPQEIAEYKMRWMPGFSVRLHSDLDWKGKDWCRKHFERHQWRMTAWTNIYEHTFHFEEEQAARQFEIIFNPYTNQ